MVQAAGQPLSRILRGQPLPPGTVFAWSIKIARVLAEVHQRGHVHRDVKPSNVLVTRDGDVDLLDFGLSNLQVGDGDGGHEGAILVGAPHYMSPEQVRGETVDARSDIFSFGVMIYEMATGKRPFTGANSDEVLHEITRAQPLSPAALVPDLPASLERIIMQALGEDRADRFQAMDDMTRALELAARGLEGEEERQRRRRITDRGGLAAGTGRRGWIFGAVAAAIAVVLAGVALRGWLPKEPADELLLVFPLEVRGLAEGAEYLGRSFAEAIAVNLAQARELHVLPVPQAGEMEGVGALARAKAALRVGAGRLITGAVTRDGERVHATMSLIDSRENRILWGTRVEGGAGDLPMLAMELARAVAGELGATFPRLVDYIGNLTGGERMSASPHTSRALSALRNGAIDELRTATRDLIKEFPNEADARALRSQALMLAWDADTSAANRAALEKSITELERSASGNPYVVFYNAYLEHRRGKSANAVKGFSAVLNRPDLTPSMRAWTLRYRALAKTAVEGKNAALADLEEALRLDPASARTFNILSQTLLDLGRPEEALVRARQAVALMPSYWRNHHALGVALTRLSKTDAARQAYDTACKLGIAQLPCTLHAIALLRAGEHKDAAATASMAATLTEDPDGTYNLACYWALAGERKKALSNLERAIELGFSGRFIRRDPDLATLHDDPEFRALVARVDEKARVAWPP